MKFVIAGEWIAEIHEDAISSALGQFGHDVHRFAWSRYFVENPPSQVLPGIARSLWSRSQRKFLAGPALSRLNSDLRRLALETRPDVVLVFRGTPIFEDTLRELKQALPATLLVSYNNDDPFSKHHPRYLWRHFLRCIPAYDLILSYRPHNVPDYERAGASRVELLRSWYLPTRHFPIALSAEDLERYRCDIVFAGHYEPDGRERILESLLREGFDLRIFGPEWNRVRGKLRFLESKQPIRAVRGLEYTKAIRAAKIALCFLSKINRDTYTRRCFEIPAIGTMLLSEYSDDLATLFEEGKDAEYFRSEDELVAKLRRYLSDDAGRNLISAGGRRRVESDGHDNVSRTRQLISAISPLVTAARHSAGLSKLVVD